MNNAYENEGVCIVILDCVWIVRYGHLALH